MKSEAPVQPCAVPLLLLLLLTAAALPASAGHASGADLLQDVDLGSDVDLKCKAPDGYDLEDLTLEWTRPNIAPEYVFLFRDGHPLLVDQQGQFRGRVELTDPTLRSGDLSIRLSGVRRSDSGQYECHVFSHSHAKKRSVFGTEPIGTVNLRVKERIQAFPGQDVVLPLDKPDYPVMSLLWKREDDPEHFVFLSGMGHPHHQHPQYDGRTEFKSQDQTQDLSVILRSVQPCDSGTYHAHIIQSQQRVKRDLHQSEPYSVVILEVASGALRLQAGLGFMAAVLASLFLQILE